MPRTTYFLSVQWGFSIHPAFYKRHKDKLVIPVLVKIIRKKI